MQQMDRQVVYKAMKPFTYAGVQYKRGDVFGPPECDGDTYERMRRVRRIATSVMESPKPKRGRPRKSKG